MQLADTGTRRRVISLTPLIDVVFILLLFFMLTTQFSRQKAMSLSVPTDTETSAINEGSPLSLHLSESGDVIVANGDIVKMESLATNAALQRAIARKTTIRLDADDAISLQLLVSVTDLLERAGVDNVQLTALSQP